MGATKSCLEPRQSVIVTSNSAFITLGISNFDNLFKAAKTIITEMEGYLDSFRENEVEMLTLSHCKKLKEPSILESVRVLFWAISAGYQGQIQKADMKMESDLAIFSMKTENLDPETDALYCSFISYLFVVSEIKIRREEFVMNYDTIISRIEKLLPKAEALIAEYEEMNEYNSNDMLELLTVNVKKLKALRKSRIEKMNKVMKDKVEELERIKIEMVKIINEADELGLKAFSADIIVPSQIFEKFHTGQRSPIVPKKELVKY